MVVKRKLVRVQERGQITLPVEFRRKWNLKPGDLVAVEETATGVSVTPQLMVASWALDRIGEMMRETGVTLEELIEAGREDRPQIVKELHGIDLDKLAT